jgi:hypothetical protein
MANATERAYTSDSDAYEVFVGQLSPAEFVAPYSEFECPIDEAIKDFIRQWPYPDEAPPSWLEDALYRYVDLPEKTP